MGWLSGFWELLQLCLLWSGVSCVCSSRSLWVWVLAGVADAFVLWNCPCYYDITERSNLFKILTIGRGVLSLASLANGKQFPSHICYFYVLCW